MPPWDITESETGPAFASYRDVPNIPNSVSALILVCVVTACSDPDDPRTADADRSVLHVAHASAMLDPAPTALAGVLQPREQLRITAPLSGPVEHVHVVLGQRVTRAQLLVELDTDGLGHNTRAARAGLEAANSQLTAAKRAHDSAAVSAAQAQVHQAHKSLANAEQTLAEANVRAPMAGVVGTQETYDGDMVVRGSRLLTIVDPASLQLEASVPTSAVPELAVGTLVELRVSGRAKVLHGTISRLAPTDDHTRRKVTVEVAAADSDDPLLAGAHVEGSVLAAR